MDPAPLDREIKAGQARNFDDLNDIVAATPFDRHLRFLNFGYRPIGAEEPVGPKLGLAFPNKDSAQLLFQVVDGIDLTDASVVEPGCGRGGNLWLLRRKTPAGSLVGIDLALGSIRYCRRTNGAPGDVFLVGDAEQLPVRTGAADVVLSIESGATYPDIECFFHEAARILRPGGHLLYADIVQHDLVDRYVEVLAGCGLEARHRRDVTDNVLAARAERAGRQQLAFAEADGQTTAAEFAGSSGSFLHHELASGEYRYVLFRMRRTAATLDTTRRLTSDERAASQRNAALAAGALTWSATGPGRS